MAGRLIMSRLVPTALMLSVRIARWLVLEPPLGDVTVEDLLNPDLVYQLGIDPIRIDVMSAVSGLNFDSAWNRRDKMMFGGLEAPVLSIEDTSCAKKVCGRPKDLIQAAELDRIVAKRHQE